MALDKEMEEPRQALYLRGLMDLSRADLADAFDAALKRSTFIPSIAELRTWAEEGRERRHREEAKKRSRALLARPEKPGDWNFKLEEIWDEIETREQEQEQRDLAYPEDQTDEDWPKVNRTGSIRPDESYIAYIRRKEARLRKATGAKLIPARIRYSSQISRIFGSDEL